eukprot:226801-Pyramimonas_sp.AAC.2
MRTSSHAYSHSYALQCRRPAALYRGRAPPRGRLSGRAPGSRARTAPRPATRTAARASRPAPSRRPALLAGPLVSPPRIRGPSRS